MTYSVLLTIVEELSEVLSGSKIEKIISVNSGGICLRCRSRKAVHHLLLSPDRSLPRIHLISSKPAASEHPSAFFLQVRKRLQGARLANVGLVGRDRIAQLCCERAAARTMLIFELFGAKSNLVLLDHGRTILSVLHPAAPGEGKGRALLPGMIYEAPAAPHSHAEARKLTGLLLPRTMDASEAAANKAVEEWYEHHLRERRETTERDRLKKLIERRLSKTNKRIDAVRSDLDAAERCEEYRLYGELILANIGRIVKGQDHADVPDFQGKIVSIPLAPALTASGNAERLFKKYKKAKTGITVLRERLETSIAEANLLRALLHDVQECTAEGLGRISSLVEDHASDAAAGRPVEQRRPSLSVPYRQVSFQGWEILIGKNAAGNDYITMALAKPHDLWLHAEGMPGSHVLVKNPGKREVPAEILRKAASLAAYYSRGKGSTRVPVAYTDAKHVRKPKGAKPGTVVLSHRRTIMAPPESS